MARQHAKTPYLMAYDIANPKRLGQVHRCLRKRGMAMQYSVFLLRLSKRELNGLLEELVEIINEREDDVRVYPVMWPGQFWMADTIKSQLNNDLLVSGGHSNKPRSKQADVLGKGKTSRVPKAKKSLFKRIFNKENTR